MSNKSDKEANIKIGNLLQAARETLGLSQADMTRKIGMPTNQISRVERGSSKASIDLLMGYCGVLKFLCSYVCNVFMFVDAFHTLTAL